jgi:hypothetical protein
VDFGAESSDGSGCLVVVCECEDSMTLRLQCFNDMSTDLANKSAWFH